MAGAEGAEDVTLAAPAVVDLLLGAARAAGRIVTRDLKIRAAGVVIAALSALRLFARRPPQDAGTGRPTLDFAPDRRTERV